MYTMSYTNPLTLKFNSCAPIPFMELEEETKIKNST